MPIGTIMIAANVVYTVILYILYGVMFMFIPGMVFYPILKERSLGYRLLFYQIAGVAYVTLVSFVLAFLHFYNTWTVWFFFVGVPILIRAAMSRDEIRNWLKAAKAEREERSLYEESVKSRVRRTKYSAASAGSFIYKKYIRGRLFQYAAAGVFVFLICWKFGYFHLTTYTYGCSDEATHIYWIQSLLNGNAFPVGMYPHGLHFMIAEFCAMFGLQPIRAYMCFTPVSVTIILFSGFLFVKKIFGSGAAAASGILVLILYDGIANTEWYYRLGVLMPMELAMFAVFVMAYGLVSWIRDGDRCSLWMVGLGIAGTTFIHIFATIIAFFVVVGFFIMYHIEMIKKRVLHHLILCGILSIFVSVVPYLVGFACGYQLEQSFSWAMSVISAHSSSSEDSSTDESTEESSDVITETEAEAESETIQDTQAASYDLKDYVDLFNTNMEKALVKTDAGGYLIAGCCLFGFIYGAAGLLTAGKSEKRKRKYKAILFAVLSWFLLFFILYACAVLNIFTLIAIGRTCVYIGLFSMVLYTAPLAAAADLIDLVWHHTKDFDRPVMAAVCAAGLVISFLLPEKPYADLIYAYTLENVDVETEQYLLDHAEKNTWTVISTTNSRLAILYDGYHYEISDLLLAQRDREELYIPTEDIYVVVENNVPYITSMKVDGSDYSEFLTEISAEYALHPISDYIAVQDGKISSSVYLDHASRLGIMSHLYYWMEALKKVYPDSVTVFLQDENCTVYHISQDQYFLLNLVVDYSEAAQEAENPGN